MTTFVPHWLELVILIAVFSIGVFRAVASVLEALHELSSNERKERIRERVVDFWLKTAELEFAAKLQLALRSRYTQMRQVRRTYLKLFAFLVALLIFIGGYDLLSTKEAVPVGFSYVLLLLPGIASIFIAPLAITVALYMAYQNVTTFAADAVKFLSFDFNETIQQALINYAIAIDLLFSTTYLVPCIALVTMHRSNRTREAFLSVTQWIADNPRGALPAMARVLRGIADVLGEFVRRKKG